METWVDVVPLTDFPPGTWRVVQARGLPVVVFHHPERGLHALQDLCTHDGGRLSGGEVDGEEVICPRHGARFSMMTGEVLAPPAYEDVLVVPVRVEGGMVQVMEADG